MFQMKFDHLSRQAPDNQGGNWTAPAGMDHFSSILEVTWINWARNRTVWCDFIHRCGCSFFIPAQASTPQRAMYSRWESPASRLSHALYRSLASARRSWCAKPRSRLRSARDNSTTFGRTVHMQNPSLSITRQAQDKAWVSGWKSFLCLRSAPDLSSGCVKTPLFAPFVYKNEHFTKTGSGQT